MVSAANTALCGSSFMVKNGRDFGEESECSEGGTSTLLVPSEHCFRAATPRRPSSGLGRRGGGGIQSMCVVASLLRGVGPPPGFKWRPRSALRMP